MDDITKYILEQEEAQKMLDQIRETSWVRDPNVHIPKEVAALAGAALAAMIIWKIMKMVARIGDPSQCKDYKFGSPSYKKCLRKAKNEKYRRAIEMLKSKMSLCSQAKKNPEKCKMKIQHKIKELEQKIQALEV